MSIEKREFGSIGGKKVEAYTLDNGRGLQAEILSLGGIVRKLIYDGVDVVLGRDNAQDYYDDDSYMGALVGRNCGRIENGEFEINGEIYTVEKNDGGICNLHGGTIGFNRKIWSAKAVDGDEPQLILSTVSPDGEEGFPGCVKVTVTYTLTKNNAIQIHYEGETDADTVLNMTNHSYFNLNGHESGAIDEHTLRLNASFFTPITNECLTNGEIRSVNGTPFDFRKPKILGTDFFKDDEQMKLYCGYDHNFVLSGSGFRKAAELIGDETNIKMQVYTDRPGVQIYTANFIKSEEMYKEGAKYDRNHAVCLETQMFPNALKYPHFPSPIIRKDEKYDTTTEYRFSKEK